jgi:hypothetical protein
MSMPIEPMPSAVNPNSPISPVHTDDPIGQSSAPLAPTVAAAESAIGPATPVTHLRIRGTTPVQYIHSTKGQPATRYARERAPRTYHTTTSVTITLLRPYYPPEQTTHPPAEAPTHN